MISKKRRAFKLYKKNLKQIKVEAVAICKKKSLWSSSSVMKSSAAFLHKREEEREMEIYDGERVL
jgi:hypothetical protein